MPRERDTPFDPDRVPRLLATGAVPPEIPFAPGRNEVPAFEVKDEQTANWLVRKIAETRAYAAHVEAYAERELRRAQREEQFFLTHYGRQLEDWAKAEIEKRGGRLKQVRLPAGTVGFRTAPGKLTVNDEQSLLAWCKENLPDAVANIERVLRSAVRDHVEKTGECPNGIEIPAPAERFYIK